MENILVCDAKGVVHEGRSEGMDPIKARYAWETSARTLGDVIDQADIFVGLSMAPVCGTLPCRAAAKLNTPM